MDGRVEVESGAGEGVLCGKSWESGGGQGESPGKAASSLRPAQPWVWGLSVTCEMGFGSYFTSLGLRTLELEGF